MIATYYGVALFVCSVCPRYVDESGVIRLNLSKCYNYFCTNKWVQLFLLHRTPIIEVGKNVLNEPGPISNGYTKEALH